MLANSSGTGTVRRRRVDRTADSVSAVILANLARPAEVLPLRRGWLEAYGRGYTRVRSRQ
jgi:hypothetical protein